MERVDFTKYIDIALRRKYWVIIPFLIVLLAGLAHLLRSPKIYEASTLILVQPQKVPQSLVQPIVQSNIEDRLRTITQQVTSRTNLESIITSQRLYTETKMLMEQKVQSVRRNIEIDVGSGRGGGSTFQISFRDKSPIKARDVTNTLASNFISENLKIRESQALGTSTFLADELLSVKKRLTEKERLVKQYREKYMGAMPEQLETNLSVLGRLQSKLEGLNTNLSDAKNRKLIIQQQAAQTKKIKEQMIESFSAGSLSELESPEESQGYGSEELASLKKRLALLETRYTANHPDVRRLKNAIEKMEAGDVSETVSENRTEALEKKPIVPTMDDFLKPQLRQINLEINNIRAEVQKVKSRMAIYQQRVEDTPKREQEMLSLNRDYENLKALYNSLLTRKLEAAIAVSMEKKQKGEQFRVIDPAKIPIMPVEPDARRIILFALLLGLGLGCGIAYLIEYMDTSFKTPAEAEKDLDIPILISIPLRYTDRELRRIRRNRVMAYVSVGAGFALSAIGIVLNVKGFDATLEFLKGIFD